MPLDRFVLIVVIIMVAAGVTIWLGALLLASAQLPWAGLAGLMLPLLVGYIVWRVAADRLRSREDDRYDRLEK